MRKRYFFLFLLFVTMIGCGTVKKSLDNYESCKSDPVCVESMQVAHDTSYVVTKGVVNTTSPALSDLIACLVSGVVSFGVGVWHGGKKKSS